VKIDRECIDRRDSTDEVWDYIDLTSRVERRSKVSILREVIQRQMSSSESLKSESSGEENIFDKLGLTETYLVASAE